MKLLRWWTTFVFLFSLSAYSQGRQQAAQNQPASQSDLPTSVPAADELQDARPSRELVTPPAKTENIRRTRKDLAPLSHDLEKEKRKIAPPKKEAE